MGYKKRQLPIAKFVGKARPARQNSGLFAALLSVGRKAGQWWIFSRIPGEPDYGPYGHEGEAKHDRTEAIRHFAEVTDETTLPKQMQPVSLLECIYAEQQRQLVDVPF